MEYRSVWAESNRRFPRLSGDITRDTVVVGGGIAGYLTAFRLAEAGRKVTLIEADRLFSGTTGKTTAKITSNQGRVYSDLYVRYGEETAKLYYGAQREGMRLIKELVGKYGIDCDFTETDGYIFSRKSDLDGLASVMKKLGSDCETVAPDNFPIARSAVKESRQYLFDPVKFLCGLPVNFEIFEHTRAVEFDLSKRTVYTDNGSIRAGVIVIATHYPVINSHGGYFMKLRQSTSYTIAAEVKITDGMYLDAEENGLSVRPYDGGTLFGGADHRTGRAEGSGFGYLYEQAEKFGVAKERVTNVWAAEDVMTFDGMPMAGLYSPKLSHVYVITGFNKWGMANSAVCAEIIRDAVANTENGYSRLFNPRRKIKKNAGAFLSNAVTNIKEILSGYIGFADGKLSKIAEGSGAVVKYRGKKRAVYRGRDGKLYVIGRMCPHMHGQLKWNAETHTWDCPCHGSRFDIYGNIISEPATKKCKFIADDGD